MKSTSLLFLVLLSLIFGCAKGPSEENLEKEVAAKLEKFKPSLFEIDSFARRGSYTFDSKGPQLLVYYKMVIKLNSSYKFGRWDQLSTSTLVNLLGARPPGIEGLNPKGNLAGDLLTVYGTNSYKDVKGKWEATSFVSKGGKAQVKKQKIVNDIEAEQKLDDSNRPEYQKLLAKISLHAKEIRKSSEGEERLEHELKRVETKMQMFLDQSKKVSGIGTAGSGGEYYQFGQAVKGVIPEFNFYETYGSIDNIKLVGEGLIDFGLAQSDLLEKSVENHPNLRAVMSLFPEAIHIVTLKKSGIVKIDQLRKRRVNIGVPGSGSHKNADKLLRSHMMYQEMYHVFKHPTDLALKKLGAGELDAVVFTGAYPYQALQGLSKDHAIRLIPPTLAMRRSLNSKGLIPLKVAKNTYSTQDRDYHTLGTTAVLFSHKDVPGATIKKLRDALFEKQNELIQIHTKASLFSKENLRQGIFIPFHQGL